VSDFPQVIRGITDDCSIHSCDDCTEAATRRLTPTPAKTEEIPSD
jgi:hypothetical protein